MEEWEHQVQLTIYSFLDSRSLWALEWLSLRWRQQCSWAWQLICFPFSLTYINSLFYLQQYESSAFSVRPGWIVGFPIPFPLKPTTRLPVFFETWTWRDAAELRKKVILGACSWKYFTSIFPHPFLLLHSSTGAASLCRKVCWVGYSLWSCLFPLRPQKGLFECTWKIGENYDQSRGGVSKNIIFLLMPKLFQKQYTLGKYKYSSPDPPLILVFWELNMMGIW